MWDDGLVSTAAPERVNPAALPSPPSPRRRRRLSTRLFVAYTATLAGAVVLLTFAPVTISVPIKTTELIGMLIVFALMLAIFNVLLHRLLGPLERLTALMRTVDPLAPGQRIEVPARAEEVAALTDAFNGMLDRLEGERRDSARRALAAQEDERQRIARELHDEVGQLLTGILLRSETLARRAGEDLRPDLEALREVARHAAHEARGIAQRLRPEALDELGLQSALLALCNAASDTAGIEIGRRLERLSPLSPEQELVIYRVAQEGITNAIRHAHAQRIDVTLCPDGDGGVVLAIADDGVGLPAGEERACNGIRGMRERALLVGGVLQIASRPQGGTEVRLRLPPEEVA